MRRHSNRFRRRGHVPAWLISGGLGGPCTEPKAGRKGPPPFGRFFPVNNSRSGPAAKVRFINSQKKFVCNTCGAAEFFGQKIGRKHEPQRRAARTWKAAARGVTQGPEYFGRVMLGSVREPVARWQADGMERGRKTRDVWKRSGRTGGLGPT